VAAQLAASQEELSFMRLLYLLLFSKVLICYLNIFYIVFKHPVALINLDTQYNSVKNATVPIISSCHEAVTRVSCIIDRIMLCIKLNIFDLFVYFICWCFIPVAFLFRLTCSISVLSKKPHTFERTRQTKCTPN
jgi:hypothetical protein